MAAISVTSVIVLDNPSPFTNPLQFEIQYECSYEIEDGMKPNSRSLRSKTEGNNFKTRNTLSRYAC
jgi:hypothetical protein